MKEITEKTKELLTAVMKKFAENKKEEMDTFEIEDNYFDASEIANDLRFIFKVIDELVTNGDVIDHLKEWDVWQIVAEWYMEDGSWYYNIKKTADAIGYKDVEDIIALFQNE